ncbi:hypothetical protein UFOVP733_38 [uncultured Caudovirales phage]|uniref:Uncharacterized protein n=1 Tax=uncultured Caudovirales phage TaxID=2100421 RepID=A0A6J7X244_9CAUD|nr:hypothetical protein UFOVP733_38 [uncultured Caudovirales phage]CAB5224870.1 hypothetical protein UFOVP743_21 [uncultured Caudovirales phage]
MTYDKEKLNDPAVMNHLKNKISCLEYQLKCAQDYLYCLKFLSDKNELDNVDDAILNQEKEFIQEEPKG